MKTKITKKRHEIIEILIEASATSTDSKEYMNAKQKVRQFTKFKNQPDEILALKCP